MRLLEKLQYGQHHIIRIAKARSFRLLGVVHPAGPVDRDVRTVVAQSASTLDRAGAVRANVLKEPIECRIVLAYINYRSCQTQSKTLLSTNRSVL